MFPLPDEIIIVLSSFAPLFSSPVWAHAQVLLVGAILAPGKRTVSAILRVMGLSYEAHYVNYHRVLNRAIWSARMGSRILFGLLVALVPSDAPVVLGADETIERRQGKRLGALGCYRDPVRSSKSHVIRCFGLKWVAMMLLVSVPFSQRVWALPFLTVLCSPDAKDKKKKACKTRHKSSVDWVRQMTRQVRRWLPDRQFILSVDGGFAAVYLVRACQQMGVFMVCRLRWDAALYDKPLPQPAGKRGPKPKKGPRQESLRSLAQKQDTPFFQAHHVCWYGGEEKDLLLFSKTALWHRAGFDPVPIRYVIVRDPEGKQRDEVFFCSEQTTDPIKIVEYFVMRWSMEVTFQEARAHLGMETLRNWKDKAIARATPTLLALFSIVTLMALRLCPEGNIPVQETAWYKKEEPTFSDLIALVRRRLWQARFYMNL